MARLPGEDSFGSLPSARSGRPIATADLTSQYDGMASLGASLNQTGQRLAARVIRDKERIDGFSAQTRFEEFRFAEAQRYEEAARNVPAGGAAGFAESYAATYRERAKEFLASVPENYKPDIDARLFDVERQLFSSGLDSEQTEQRRFATNTLDDTLNNSILPRVQTAATEADLATIVTDGERLIDANPALTPAERDEAKRAWREQAQTAFLNEVAPEDRGAWLGILPSEPESIRFIEARGSNLTTDGVDGEFSSRLAAAISAAEAATGQTAEITDLVRSAEMQAQYYANYTQQPVVWNGVTYQPGAPGGLAAPPGQSRHQGGAAADIARGPVLDWLHEHAAEYGLAFLEGDAFERDPVHIQMAGGPPTAPPVALGAISYGDRLAYAADAEAAAAARRNAAAAQLQNEYDAQVNSLMVGILDGSAGLQDVLRLRNDGVLTDYDDIRRAVDAIATRDEDVLKLQEALTNLSDPAFTYNPFDPDQREAVDDAYEALGGTENLLAAPRQSFLSWQKDADQPQREALSRLVAVVDRTNIVPDSALSVLRGGIWSQNPETRDTAMTVLDGIHRHNPEAVERALSEEDLARLQTYQVLSPLLEPEELNRIMAPITDPREAARIDTLRTEGRDLAREVLPEQVLTDLGRELGLGGFLTGAVDTNQISPIERQELNEITGDYEALFAERYAVTGNADTAHRLAIQSLKQKWNYTDAGARRSLIAYAPETQYPTLNGDHSWMKDDLQGFVTAAFGENISDYGIVSTLQTEAALGTQHIPYRVVAIDEDGMVQSAIVEFDYERARVQMLTQFAEERVAIIPRGPEVILPSTEVMGGAPATAPSPQLEYDPGFVPPEGAGPAVPAQPTAQVPVQPTNVMASEAPVAGRAMTATPATQAALLAPPAGVPTTPQEMSDLIWAQQRTDMELVQARDELAAAIATQQTPIRLQPATGAVTAAAARQTAVTAQPVTGSVPVAQPVASTIALPPTLRTTTATASTRIARAAPVPATVAQPARLAPVVAQPVAATAAQPVPVASAVALDAAGAAVPAVPSTTATPVAAAAAQAIPAQPAQPTAVTAQPVPIRPTVAAQARPVVETLVSTVLAQTAMTANLTPAQATALTGIVLSAITGAPAPATPVPAIILRANREEPVTAQPRDETITRAVSTAFPSLPATQAAEIVASVVEAVDAQPTAQATTVAPPLEAVAAVLLEASQVAEPAATATIAAAVASARAEEVTPARATELVAQSVAEALPDTPAAEATSIATRILSAVPDAAAQAVQATAAAQREAITAAVQSAVPEASAAAVEAIVAAATTPSAPLLRPVEGNPTRPEEIQARYYALPTDYVEARRDEVRALVTELSAIVGVEGDPDEIAARVLEALDPVLQIEVGPNGRPVPAATLEERRLDVTLELLSLLDQQRTLAAQQSAEAERARLADVLTTDPSQVGAPGVAPPVDVVAPKNSNYDAAQVGRLVRNPNADLTDFPAFDALIADVTRDNLLRAMDELRIYAPDLSEDDVIAGLANRLGIRSYRVRQMLE